MGGFGRSWASGALAGRRWRRLLAVGVLAGAVVCSSSPSAPAGGSPAEGFELWVWGRNDSGQLGLGTSGGDVVFPQRIGTDADLGWSYIDVGLDSRFLGIHADGTYGGGAR